MNIEDKMTDKELADLRVARTVDRAITAPIHVNSESDLISRIRMAYAAVEDVLTALPASRRKSIALTELETSAMFAVKAAYEAGDRND